jgi:hypothetical protein
MSRLRKASVTKRSHILSTYVWDHCDIVVEFQSLEGTGKPIATHRWRDGNCDKGQKSYTTHDWLVGILAIHLHEPCENHCLVTRLAALKDKGRSAYLQISAKVPAPAFSMHVPTSRMQHGPVRLRRNRELRSPTSQLLLRCEVSVLGGCTVH